jgi:uncharacterized cupredoxin-like copper-binding protein
MYLRKLALAAAVGSLCVLSFLPASALAHGGSHKKKAAAKPDHVNAEDHAFGRAGDPEKAARTIQVGMDDSMHFVVTASARPDRTTDVRMGDEARFAPGDIVVNTGETLRFVVRNDGKAMHEMVVGTMKALKDHAELMRKFPGMEHDEPYMAHVAPGKEGEIVWQFTRAGEFHYACLVPGHLEAGMIARIIVQ